MKDKDARRLPGSSKNLTAEDRAIFDSIKRRANDGSIGAQYRLDDFHDAELMRAMTEFNA
jgi:hypothetical protein